MISEAASDPLLDLTALRAACASLPALPSVIRYFDDYAEKHRSIKAPERHSIWTLMLDGRSKNSRLRPAGQALHAVAEACVFRLAAFGRAGDGDDIRREPRGPHGPCWHDVDRRHADDDA